MRIWNRWALPFIGPILFSITLLAAWGTIRARGAPASQANPGPETIASFNMGGCATCHTIPGIPNATGVVGPDLSAIADRAGTQVSGTGAEDYLIESILNPNAFVAPDCPLGPCPASVMPPNMDEKLTPDDIDRIVAYLLTLAGQGAVAEETYILTPIEIVRPPETGHAPFAEPPKTYEDAQILLGKYLFFDSRLSGNTSISCASCHQPENAFTDGLPLSAGYPSTLYFRNTPTLLNTAFQDFLYWDGRMDGGDMPTLVRDHLTEAHFMNTDGRLMVERVKQVPEYVQLFEDAYGSGPSFGRILNSITAYVQSLNSAETPYDRFLAGDSEALSPEATAGLELFEGKAGCQACHNGPVLSDGRFYALGVPDQQDIRAEPLRHITFRRFFRQLGVPNYRALDADPGLYALTKKQSDWAAFRTAPLRELVHTAPYMHNGAFESLEAVVEFYNSGAGEGDPLELTAEEIEQLVAFLESLSTELPEVIPPELPSYQLRTLGDNQ